MSCSQHFIVVSTSAVTEGSFGAKEDSAIISNIIDYFSMSMFKNEVRLQEFMEHYERHHCPKISLLQFGTVVGNSPGQRTDLMIPRFFCSAYTTGNLEVGGHNTTRSFLTLPGFSNAIYDLISKTNYQQMKRCC